MPTAEKEQAIDKARDWYSRSVGVVFADYRGLTVKEIQGLRSDLRKRGGEIHVLKNTLFRIAAGEHAGAVPDEFHNGTTAYAFVLENEADVAKALLDYARTSKKLVVKGGLFAGRSVDANGVQAISELPPRDVLIAQVIGAISAPLSGLVGTVEALYADPIRVVAAVADKVGEGSPPAEASNASADADATPTTDAEPAASADDTPAATADAAPDAQPEVAPPPAEQPLETSADTDSTESTS